MTLNNIACIRLQSQQIESTKFKTAGELVGWMGAVQAQDQAMAKYALGVRLPGSNEQSIEKALYEGEIIRTHLLRPTWHLVSAQDIYWIVELTAPQIKTSMNFRNKELELTETIFKKSNGLIEKSLRDNNYLTRDELITLLNKSKITTDENRAAHIMMQAELDGIVCSGPTTNKKQTYALLSDRVPKAKILTRDEALAKLALIYFRSHSPATLQDFTWWSGLSVKDSKNALEMVRSNFISEVIDSETYWLSNSFSQSIPKKSDVYLLPAFDEFLISYKNRTASLSVENQKKAFTSNGIFRPVIVFDGKVIGLWKSIIKKEVVIVETEFFITQNKEMQFLLKKAEEKFHFFIDKNRKLL